MVDARMTCTINVHSYMRDIQREDARQRKAVGGSAFVKIRWLEMQRITLMYYSLHFPWNDQQFLFRL